MASEFHKLCDLNDLNTYDYELPEELIAQTPIARRDESRLMVVERATGNIRHCRFADLPNLLAAGDLLVFNDTRVVPAKLTGKRRHTGGKWEGLYLREEAERTWRIIGKTRGRLEPGEFLDLTPASMVEQPAANPTDSAAPSGALLPLQLLRKETGGEWIVKPHASQTTLELLEQFGTMPLPHYMQREAAADDRDRYQTLFATHPGAVAAPTAGLHFTPEVLAACEQRGIQQARVTLHVGLGTFRPVKVARLDEHEMHSEWCRLTAETAARINQARQQQGRIVAVGTTSVRTLETAAMKVHPEEDRTLLKEWEGETKLFIRPPFPFRVVDVLLTNFHLPKSTLLVLVSTLAGRELIREAYAEAIRQRYRFFSYGDAMLIL